MPRPRAAAATGVKIDGRVRRHSLFRQVSMSECLLSILIDDAENMKLSLYEPQTKLRFELTFSGAVCLRAAWRACMGPGVSGHGQTGGAERLERRDDARSRQIARDGAHRSQRGRGEDQVGNHCDVAAAVVSSLLGYTLRSSGRDTDLEKHGRL